MTPPQGRARDGQPQAGAGRWEYKPQESWRGISRSLSGGPSAGVALGGHLRGEPKRKNPSRATIAKAGPKPMGSASTWAHKKPRSRGGFIELGQHAQGDPREPLKTTSRSPHQL
ncbi:unnamed protein product [Calypogeia fissa]